MGEKLSAAERLRYARQITLADWGDEGQIRLRESRVFVVGLGGLGSPVATYLAGAGVGHLTLNDFDQVDASNLPRQPLHDEHSIGQAKTQSAQQRIEALNHAVHVRTIDRRLSVKELTAELGSHDVVVDASDNFGTRFGVNKASVLSDTSLVSAAAIRHDGQLAVFHRGVPEAACYACLYNDNDETTEDCAGQGVMTPLVGVMGSLAAMETLKLLLGWPRDNGTYLHCFDALGLRWRRLRVPRDAQCEVCRDLK